ncbi:recombinase family protein [Streptomyces noursei]|uniref:recombinase family protein n=1 Tax=Streptomyces noursei TaxID=1971 RepID=UPI0037F70FE7
MEREDRATLLDALGFEVEELKTLGLWELTVGAPEDLAEMYVRRSKKKDTVRALREQVRTMCRHADSEGKRIRHVWFEQRSASKSYVKREEFDNATRAVLDGKSKTLYVYKMSRLSRRGMGQVGPLLDEFDRRRARIYVVVEHIDSSKGSRTVLAILSEQAREQVHDLAQFVKLGMDAAKSEGKWPGGVTPYGLQAIDGKLTHRPNEYPTARRIAEALLKRKTPVEVAKWLNAEGIRTRNGALWRAPAINALIHSPAWAGLMPNRERVTDEFGSPIDRYYRGGEPLMHADGTPVTCGVGVITYEERMQLLGYTAERSTGGANPRGKRAAKALLSKLLRCPHCQGVMTNGGGNYRCIANTQQGPTVCKGAATQRAQADAAIETMWKNHTLSLSPESPTLHEIARRWLSYEDPAMEVRKRAVETALSAASARELKLQKEFFIGGGMDEGTYDMLRTEVATQIAGMKAELADLARSADLTPLKDAEELAALWERETVEGKRALLRATLVCVRMLPAARKGDPTPIAKRLRPDWRDQGDTRPAELALAHVELTRQRRKATEAGSEGA